MKMREGKRVVMSFTDIAQEVTKIGGGHPSKQAIAELAAIVEKDHLWFPGKVSAHAKNDGQSKGSPGRSNCRLPRQQWP